MKRTLPSFLLIALSVVGIASQKPTVKEPDRKVYVVGTAHLDTQWRWTIQKTITDYIPDTLMMNLDYFDKYPDYIFSFEGSIRYALAKEYYPELYAKMKQRIKEGRWRVAGSWIDAVDVNMPSPEALIRQNLYGNGFFKKEFGKTSVDVFLPDCFGFGYALPSIAAHCGLTGFTTQKLLPYGSSYGGVPFNIGTWEGVDGSSIMAVLEPGRYRNDVGTDWYKADWLLKRIDELGLKSGLFLDLRLHGTGDRGGGPTKRSMDNLANCIKAKGPIKVVSKGSDDLFRELKPEQIAKLPHYNGELLMATHGTGCYTTQAAVKRWNRKNELLADAAERAATMAALLGVKYPQQTLTDAWIRFLWHGFHDDLTGTSIPEVYEFTWNDQILSLNQFSEVLTDSIRVISRNLDTRFEGVPVVVYNPLAISRTEPVLAELDFDQPSVFVRVFDPSGREVPAQVVEWRDHTARVVFLAHCEGLGATVYEVRRSSVAPRFPNPLKVSERTLENERYRVRVDDQGDIASIYDKASGRELLKSPIRLALRKDKPTRYAAWEMNYEDVIAVAKEFVSGPAQFRILENGPVRVSLAVSRTCAGSQYSQILSLGAGGRRVDIENDVEWRSRGLMLKAEFPFSFGNPKATYDIGLGTIERGNDRKALYEVPAQQWADITQTDGRYGVSILSESKYGWDKPSDDMLRMTLIRTPEVKDTDYQFNNDQGEHGFNYAIYGHEGSWRNGTSREGECFNQPIIAFNTTKHAGKLGRSFSLALSSTPGISIKAIKKAEQSNEWIVRVFETSGQAIDDASIQFGAKVLGLRELNGFESALRERSLPMVAKGNTITFDMKPYRPRTFAVRFAPVLAGKAQNRSVSLQLPFNIDVVTQQGERNAESTIPSELWPKSIQCGEAKLDLGPANGKNAMECRGQELHLPEGATRVVILANSTEKEFVTAFQIDDSNYNIPIPYRTGFIGHWDNQLVNGQVEPDPDRFDKAYIDRTPVGWVATHRHSPEGKDEPYTYEYLYKIEILLPEGAKSMWFSDHPGLRVYAVSAISDDWSYVVPCKSLYD